jgi:uncharacterized coiled-coil protein SlyX
MKTSERLTGLERSAAQHDKQIKAIRNLVQEGMRLLVETRKEGRETRKDLRTLTANVNQLESSLRPTNGHGKRRIDLN